MHYLFNGSWEEVPVYAPYEGCRRIAVDYTVPVTRVEPLDQRVIERSWRKLIAFFFAEGVATTIRKVRSKRAASRLSADYHIVFALGRDFDAVHREGTDSVESTFLCLGTRHPGCAEVMLFASELTIPLDVAPSRSVMAAAVSKVVAQADDMSHVGGYNVYSDIPAPAAGVRLLDAVAASLEGVDETQAGSRVQLPEVIEPARDQAPSPRTPGRPNRPPLKTTHGAAVIAGGDYVRTDVVPALKRGGFALRVVADLEPHVAAYTRRHFRFDAATTDWRNAINHPDADTVVIASFHDSHATIAAEALSQGKNVLLEKPPVVTREDLDLLLAAARGGGFLEVGYNRRYAPFARSARKLLSQAEGPTTMTMLVKEVEIPAQHWYRWPKEGTRVTGNLCHWIDLAVFLLGQSTDADEMVMSPPADVEPDEERTLTIGFRGGSTVTIVATQRGDATLGVQELIDIRRGDLSIRIDDFRKLHVTQGGRRIRHAYSRRNKGHRAMYIEMLRRIKNGEPAHYSLQELELTSRLTIAATEMVRSGSLSMRGPTNIV